MALFKDRPLAAAALLLIITVFFCFFLDGALVIALCAVSGAALFFMVGFIFKKGLGNKSLVILLCLAAVLFGALRVQIDSSLRATWQKDMQTSGVAELRVREVKRTSAYGSVLLVEVERWNGEEKAGNAVLRCDYAAPFVKNDRISGEFVLQALDAEIYYPYEKYSYMAQGAHVSLYSQTDEGLRLLESGNRSLGMRLEDLRARLSLRLRSLLSDKQGELLSAMLLGDRSGLSDEVARDFRRTGVSHLLAISGLHLMILIGLLDRVLYLLRLGRRWRMGITLPCCAAYVLLTGAQPSMLRACAMLLFVYAAVMLGERSDALTSLFAIASLLVVISPAVIFDLSYQMTMLSTFGLLAFGRLNGMLSGRIPRGRGVLRVLFAALRYLLSSLLVTLSVSLSVLPVMWLVFGELSLVMPLGNLLLVPLAAPLLIGGIALLLLPLSPIAFCVDSIAYLMLEIVAFLSKGNVVLSLRYPFLPYIFIPLLFLTAILLVIDLKKRAFLLYVPTVIAILVCAVCLAIFRTANADRLQIAYRSEGNSEGILAVQNGIAVLFDSSNGSLTQLRADYALASELYAAHLEALVLTHYHERHVSSISAFSKEVLLRELWLPQALSEQDMAIQKQLLAMAQKRGIKVNVFLHQLPVGIFEKGEFALSYPLYEKRSVQPTFSFLLSYGKQSVCYHAASFDEFSANAGQIHTCTADRVIVGAHGPVVHAEIRIENQAATLVIAEPALLPYVELLPERRRVIAQGRYFFVME